MPEFALGERRPGEDEQAARFLVEPVDDAQRRQRFGRPVELARRWPTASGLASVGSSCRRCSDHSSSAGWRTVFTPAGFSTTTTWSSRWRMTRRSAVAFRGAAAGCVEQDDDFALLAAAGPSVQIGVADLDAALRR